MPNIKRELREAADRHCRFNDYVDFYPNAQSHGAPGLVAINSPACTDERCEDCGWNPEVARRRLEELEKECAENG